MSGWSAAKRAIPLQRAPSHRIGKQFTRRVASTKGVLCTPQRSRVAGMKGAAELADVRRREDNARWLHLWKGEQVFELSKRGAARRRSPNEESSMSLRTSRVGHCDEALENGVPVVAVDRAMSDAAISQILNEVRDEEVLSDAAFVGDDQVDLFAHRRCVDSEVARRVERLLRVRGLLKRMQFVGGLPSEHNRLGD